MSIDYDHLEGVGIFYHGQISALMRLDLSCVLINNTSVLRFLEMFYGWVLGSKSYASLSIS